MITRIRRISVDDLTIVERVDARGELQRSETTQPVARLDIDPEVIKILHDGVNRLDWWGFLDRDERDKAFAFLELLRGAV